MNVLKPNQIISIVFLLVTICIALAFSNIPFLVSAHIAEIPTFTEGLIANVKPTCGRNQKYNPVTSQCVKYANSATASLSGAPKPQAKIVSHSAPKPKAQIGPHNALAAVKRAPLNKTSLAK
jgi:hypothetical protein